MQYRLNSVEDEKARHKQNQHQQKVNSLDEQIEILLDLLGEKKVLSKADLEKIKQISKK